jgi:hypothetical protein
MEDDIMKTLTATTLLFLITIMINPVTAQVWSQWEKENSIAQFGSFLVIKQPLSNPPFCYIKQSYEDIPGKMDFSMKPDRVPSLTHPFFRGIGSDLIYQVDNGPVRSIKSTDVRPMFPIYLNKKITSELISGRTLHLRFRTKGYTNIHQKVPLDGFRKSLEKIGSKICK